MFLKDKWKKLHPNAQRLSVVAGAIGVVALGVLLMPSKSSKDLSHSKQEEIRHVLTDRDTRTVGLESLAASVENMRNKTTKQARLIEKLERDLDLAKKQSNQPPPIMKGKLSDLDRELRKLQDKLDKLESSGPRSRQQDGVESIEPEGAVSASETVRDSFLENGSGYGDLTLRNPVDVFNNGKLSTTVLDDKKTSSKKSSGGKPKINVVQEQKAEPKEKDKAKKEDRFYLPAGSIITGVLLNGMDAPTGQGARKDPFPVTLRVQKEAILPNRFRADIRECFVVVSGYGDLSSERAYLRGETLSCVRADGAVIESKFDSYAVGEDGKAGVRGRLVSKQGQVIARSLMAGFMSGLSKAFDVKPVAVLDTSNSGSTNYQRNEPNADWLRSSAASGASSALDRVADFYMKMAEGMFPVIEVDAGRQVDLIISGGAQLQVRSTGSGQQ